MKLFTLFSLIFSFSAFSQIETKEIYPVEDTWVSSSSANKNNGSDTRLSLGTYHAGTRALMKFDKNELLELLKDKELISATLELPIKNHYIHRTGVIGLHRMTKQWSESTATWKCANDSNVHNWHSDCAGDSWLMWSHNPNNTISYPYEEVSFATSTIERNQEMPLGFDVGSYVSTLITEENNYGFAIFKDSTNINGPLELFSRESDITPKLVLKLKNKVVISQSITAKLTSNLKTGVVPLNVIFDGSSSSTLTGSITSYSLDLGDGKKIELDKNNPVYTYSYKEENEYQAVLTVKNTAGEESVSSINISAIGVDKSQVDNNYGYWITPNKSLKVNYKAGEQAVITGDICKVWKTSDRKNNPHCHWVDKSRLHIQAFYPDMTSDVSSFFKITQKGQKREFEYKTPTLVADDLNVLTVLVGEIDPRVIRFGSIKAKLQRRLRIVNERLVYFKKNRPDSYIVKVLERVRFHISKICKKIDERNAKQPTVLAQYNYPLQVDNKVSAPRYYSTLIGGFRVELSSEFGNLFEGEKVQIKSRVSNLNYSESKYHKTEQYKFKYSYKGEHLKTLSELNFGKSQVHEYNFIDQEKSIANALYDFDVEIIEKYKWWERKLASAYTHLPVIQDTVAPLWINKISVTQYAQDFPKLTSRVKDEIGRIDTSTLNIELSGQMSGNITEKFETSTSDKGTEYLFSGAIKDEYNEEGDYVVSYSVKDFKGQDAAPKPYKVNYTIDRTKPQLIVAQEDNQLTNNPEFLLPISVVDHSPITVSVIHNGNKIGEFNDKDSSFSLTLTEEDNVIEVKVVDAAGNEGDSFKLSSIHLDTIPPVLSEISPKKNEIIRFLKYEILGTSNEPLSKVEIDSQTELLANLSESGLKFHHDSSRESEGLHSHGVKAFDLAGNSTEVVTDFEILLKLLRIELVTLEPVGDGSKIIVRGLEGAGRPYQAIHIDGGFFNSTDVIAAKNGSFEAELKYAHKYTLSAEDPEYDRKERYTIEYKADTTFTGYVKDVNDNPLPGVKVSIISSGQSAITDGNGVFQILEPALGDQNILIDGTSIPSEHTLGMKEYSQTNIKVSLGSLQRNVLGKVIYLTPKLLDGSEVSILNGESVVVESDHARGVSLQIPADSIEFPDGSNSGSINMMEISADKVTVDLPEQLNPKTVIALEPSGVKFKKRVELILPNYNELPDGTEMVILSKNSSTGLWEVDGAAVVAGDKVVTKKDMGISHFSEVFAAPFGMEMKSVGPEDKPGITNNEGVARTSVELPSFKIRGQDIKPSLIYSSSWANPLATITNVFDIPRKEMILNDSETSGGAFGVGKTTITGKSWIEPEYIESQFYSGSVKSDKLRFTGVPNKSVVSYSMDLSSMESGVYPARSTYVMQLKQMTIGTVRSKTYTAWGTVHVKTKDIFEQDFLDLIFPPDLNTNLYHVNKKDSEFGRGWKLSGIPEILNPNNDRIALEGSDGSVSSYTLENTVETVTEDVGGIESFNLNENGISYADKQGRIKFQEYADENGIPEPTVLKTTENYTGMVGVNSMKFLRRGSYCCKSGFNGCKKRCPDYQYHCEKRRFTHDIPKKIKRIYDLGGDSLIYLDENGAIYNYGANETRVTGSYEDVGRIDLISQSTYLDYQPYCKNNIHNNCSNQNYYTNHTFWIDDRRAYSLGNCGYSGGNLIGSSGKFPKKGSRNGTLSQAQFNTPVDMVMGLESSTMFVADYGNNVIRKVDIANGDVFNYAGNNTTYDNGNDGHRLSAGIFHPTAIARDSLGNLFITSERGYVRRIDVDGTITHVAGNPSGLYQEVAPMKEMRMNAPSGIVLDEENKLIYVSDTGNHRILRLDLERSEARVIAGTGLCSSATSFDGLPALDTSICSPRYISLDKDKNLVFIDGDGKRIRKVLLQDPTDGIRRFASSNKDGSTLTQNKDKTFTLKTRNRNEIIFKSNGKVIESMDTLNNIVSYHYNENDLLSEIKYPIDNSSMKLEYSNGELMSLEDPSGKITYTNIVDGELRSIQFSNSQGRSYVYNGHGQIIEEMNERGFSKKYFYNTVGNLSKIVLPSGKDVQISDSNSNSIANGASEDEPMPLNSVEDETNPLVSVYTDAEGNNTVLNKDLSGYVETITDSKGRESRIERDLEGRPLKIIKFDNSYTDFEYNILGDLTSKHDSSSGETEKFDYNGDGNLLSYTNTQNKKKENYYDNQTGLLIRSKDYEGNSIYKTYYADGLLETVYNDKNEVTQFLYNEAGNLRQKISPEGEIVEYIRDAVGNIIEKINSNGVTTLYTYDDFNRLTSVATGVTSVDPIGVLTSYLYSETGQLISIIDPEGNTTSFEYNELDQLIKKTSALGQVTELDYDGNGNVIWEKDAKGNVKTFEYDSDNLLVKKILPDNIYEMSYDDYSNMTRIADSDSEIIFSYEKIGKEYYVNKTNSSGADIPSSEIQYNYDDLGNRTSMSTGWGIFSYAYDSNSRLTGITNHKDENFNFEYDVANRLTKTLRPGSTTNYNFDANSFLTSLVHKKSANSIIESFTYTRDAIGNRKSITTSRGVASFDYDEESQLKTVSNTEIVGSYATESFNYDSLGNRLNDQLGNYNYDGKKQRLISDYKYSYQYDKNGNMSSRQESGMTGNLTNYTYNSENQLIGIDEFKNNIKVKSSSYQYDALGRRISKAIVDHVTSSKSFTRKYIYDGQEILAELDKDDNTLAVFTHSTLRTDDVLAADIKSTKLATSIGSYFYLKDALGSVIDITDDSGSIVQHYAYSAFGKIVNISDGSGNDVTSNPPVKTSYGFTNREHDEESGMMFYRARFYSPEIGRFISEDPFKGIRVVPGTVINSYIYVLNNPLKYNDPDGRIAPIFVAMLIGAAIGGGSYLLFTDPKDRSFSGFLGASVGGAVSGAIAFYAGPWGELGLGQAMMWGAAAGAGGQTANLLVQGEDITTRKNTAKIISAGVIGGVTGGIANGLMSRMRSGTVDSEIIEFGDKFIDYGTSGAEGGAQEVGGQVIDAVDKIKFNILPH